MLPSWVAFTDEDQWDLGTTYVYVVFFSLFHLTAQHSPTFHLPCQWMHSCPLHPTAMPYMAQWQQRRHHPLHNNSNRNAKCGATIVTAMPYMVQQQQLQHHMRCNNSDGDPHTAQQQWPRHPTWHNNCDRDHNIMRHDAGRTRGDVELLNYY